MYVKNTRLVFRYEISVLFKMFFVACFSCCCFLGGGGGGGSDVELAIDPRYACMLLR